MNRPRIKFHERLSVDLPASIPDTCRVHERLDVWDIPLPIYTTDVKTDVDYIASGELPVHRHVTLGAMGFRAVTTYDLHLDSTPPQTVRVTLFSEELTPQQADELANRDHTDSRPEARRRDR